MRLIDADAVIPKGTKVTDDVIAVHNALVKAPTIDAVPVVRCKDCFHYRCDFTGYWDCNNPWGMRCARPDEFCSLGKRKDGDG